MPALSLNKRLAQYPAAREYLHWFTSVAHVSQTWRDGTERTWDWLSRDWLSINHGVASFTRSVHTWVLQFCLDKEALDKMRSRCLYYLLLGVIFAITFAGRPGASALQAETHVEPSSADGNLTLPRADAIEEKQGLHERRLRYQQLGGGRELHYNTFLPIAPSFSGALSLCYFWTEVAYQVSRTDWMPDDQFLGDTFRLRMPASDEAMPGVLDLVFEVFSFDGPVSRELVVSIAAAMMEYCLRGFCGFFNAFLRQAPSRGPIWILFRLQGLPEYRAGVAPAV
ncbi:MAG: hypothetical protein Q9207_008095 [Kuettlingeria erythrocarpa]